MKTPEVVAGEKCYGCNQIAYQMKQFEQYTIEQRTKAIVRMSSETEALLTKWSVSSDIPREGEIER